MELLLNTQEERCRMEVYNVCCAVATSLIVVIKSYVNDLTAARLNNAFKKQL